MYIQVLVQLMRENMRNSAKRKKIFTRYVLHMVKYEKNFCPNYKVFRTPYLCYLIIYLLAIQNCNIQKKSFVKFYNNMT